MNLQLFALFISNVRHYYRSTNIFQVVFIRVKLAIFNLKNHMILNQPQLYSTTVLYGVTQDVFKKEKNTMTDTPIEFTFTAV